MKLMGGEMSEKHGTRLTKKFVKHLPSWAQVVLLRDLKMKMGDYVLTTADYMVPWDKIPEVRLIGAGKDVSHVILGKETGMLDIYTGEDGKIQHYVNCFITSMSMGNNAEKENDITSDIPVMYRFNHDWNHKANVGVKRGSVSIMDGIDFTHPAPEDLQVIPPTKANGYRFRVEMTGLKEDPTPQKGEE
jgi:hypothetical protein